MEIVLAIYGAAVTAIALRQGHVIARLERKLSAANKQLKIFTRYDR